MRCTGRVLIVILAVCFGAHENAAAQNFNLKGVLDNLGKEILSPDLDDGPASSGQGVGSGAQKPGGGAWPDPDSQPKAQSPSVAGSGYSPAQIAEAQRLLTAQGYQPGVVDGQMGRKTRDAIRQFQRDHGAPATGQPDDATLALLRATSAGQGGSVALKPVASFGCAVAQTASERAICGSVDLARLDRAVAMAFRNARDSAPTAQDRERIIRDQRDWLADRESCGDDAHCVDLQMSLRIAALGADQIALVAALKQADEANALVASGPALSGDAAQLDDDGAVYNFLLDRYIATYPDITASDDFVKLYASRQCADANAKAALERASVNEFDQRDFMQRWRDLVPQVVSQAQSRPATGRLEREFRLTLPSYDFDRQRFELPSNQGSGALRLHDQQRCQSGLAGDVTVRPYPASFRVVSTSGGGLGAADIGEMIGGNLPMSPTEARSHLNRYGRDLRIKATYEVGQPERLSPHDNQGVATVTGRVVAVALEAKEPGSREWRPFFRFDKDRIVNPSKVDQSTDTSPELTYDDLLSRYLRAFPGTVADQRTAAGWAYRDDAGQCSDAFSTAAAQDEFRLEEMLRAAPALAAAAIKAMPEPPHRFVFRRNVRLDQYDFSAGAFPLSGGLATTGDKASAMRKARVYGDKSFCADYLDGRFPKNFELTVRNAAPTFALGFPSSEEASNFLREKGLIGERSLVLEYELEIDSLERASERSSLGEARVVAARLLDRSGEREILKFSDQAFVEASAKAAELADEMARTVERNRSLSFGELLIAYVGANPELVENDDVVWTYLGIQGCEWDKNVLYNEIWEREMLGNAREALRRDAKAAPKGSLGLFRHAERLQFGFYEFEQSLFPVVGDDSGATSIRFNVPRQNKCGLPRGSTAPQNFVIEIRNVGPVLSTGLPMDALKGKRFLGEYGPKSRRRIWLDLELEVAAPRMAIGSDGPLIIAAAVASKARALADKDRELLFEYTGLDPDPALLSDDQ